MIPDIFAILKTKLLAEYPSFDVFINDLSGDKTSEYIVITLVKETQIDFDIEGCLKQYSIVIDIAIVSRTNATNNLTLSELFKNSDFYDIGFPCAIDGTDTFTHPKSQDNPAAVRVSLKLSALR